MPPTVCRVKALAILTVSLGLAAAIDASASPRTSTPSIKVCSAYGKGCLLTPTRKGPWGLEVRLPSGTWIDCRGDCREAVRQDLLDFWETQAEKAQIVH